ncbi:glutathione S-transferase family protein [Pontixanthobacter sp. CEM42]|uniref:glutathione S-transferase family protein n=1 Tax=Pontixanthobacter sp. CEM42 TaxID=2792077 RepID=UPI001ADFA1BE|nr:glutathione S-transferase family protein [Pontixanthobacter sp. CEM42]
MADYTFFTNPMSRGQIVRWALHEASADYETQLVDWTNKPKGLLDANPMGKVPTLVHHHGDHAHVITEAAAICAYLAEASAPELLPTAEERASYLRWMFFAAGPLEQAVIAKSMGWDVPDGKEAMAGFGTYDRTVETLISVLSCKDFICGDRFTMADVYVGSQVDWGIMFKSLPDDPVFTAYAERLRDRPKYKEAKGIDMALIAEAESNR